MQSEIVEDYHPSSSLQQADAVAWVVTSKDSDLQLYPFKFLPIGPEEVRIKILHTAICKSDTTTLRGQWEDYYGSIAFPFCTGHQIIGEVTQIGTGVTSLKIGDKVGASQYRFSDMTCKYCQMNNHQLCQNAKYIEAYHFGGHSTHVQIDHNWAIKLPEGIDLKETAPLLGAGIIVYAPLKRFLKIGGKCAVIGIGGLGHLAIQFANKLGMEVTAFTTKLENAAALRQLGAADVQHSTDADILRQNAGKYDICLSNIYDVDASVYKMHQRLLRKGGVYLLLGVPSMTTKYELDIDNLLNNEITVAGSIMGSITELKDMLQFSAKYGIKSINEHFDFQDYPRAFERVEKENPRYRVVVDVIDWAKKNGFDK